MLSVPSHSPERLGPRNASDTADRPERLAFILIVLEGDRRESPVAWAFRPRCHRFGLRRSRRPRVGRIDERAGPPEDDARLRAVPEDERAARRRGALGRCQRHMERRQHRLRLRARRQALSLRRRIAQRRPRLEPRRTQRRPAAAGGAADAAAPASSAAGRRHRPMRPTASSRRSTAIATSGSATPSGGNESAITTDGNDKDRIKYGTASWVYGEELAQTSAMWWSPDSRRSPTTASTRSRCPTTTCSSTRPRCRASTTSRPIPRPARRIRSSTSSCYDVATKKSTRDRRARRQAVRQQRRRPLRLSRLVVARRHGAAVQPHQPAPERPGVRRRRPRDRRDARRSSARSGRPAGSTTVRRCSSSKTTAASSGSRSATASPTSISTTSPAS